MLSKSMMAQPRCNLWVISSTQHGQTKTKPKILALLVAQCQITMQRESQCNIHRQKKVYSALPCNSLCTHHTDIKTMCTNRAGNPLVHEVVEHRCNELPLCFEQEAAMSVLETRSICVLWAKGAYCMLWAEDSYLCALDRTITSCMLETGY